MEQYSHPPQSGREQVFLAVPRASPGQPQLATGPKSIRWRVPALLLTPALVSMINLGEAHFEKVRGFEVGNVKYDQYRGRAEEERRAVVESAHEAGKARKSAIIAEAEAQARVEVQLGEKERETRIKQGNAKGSIPISLANGMIITMFGKTTDVVRLIHDRAELEMGVRYRRYLKVDRKTGQYEVQQIGSTPESAAEMQNRLATHWSTLGNQLRELSRTIASDGGRELASFAGGPCLSSN